jgi:phenylalanyl-tRNA synthetase beta chain
MKVPLSWIKDFISIDMPVEDLARQLTLAGLEVEEIRFVRPPTRKQHWSWRAQPARDQDHRIAWDPEKIVVGGYLK